MLRTTFTSLPAVFRSASASMIVSFVRRYIVTCTLVFAALIGAALYLRRNSGAHKRLMLLATLELATAGVARLPLIEDWGPVGFFGVADLFVVALVVYDVAVRKRVHAATIWGGLFLVASQPLRLAIGGSDPWISFASWLIA